MPRIEQRLGLDVLGDAELVRALRQLSATIERKFVREEMRKAWKKTHAQVKANLPPFLRKLRSRIKLRVGKKQKRGEVLLVIATPKRSDLVRAEYTPKEKIGSRGGRGIGYYPAAWEFGYVAGGKKSLHRERYRTKRGQFRTRTVQTYQRPGRPIAGYGYMRRALAETERPVLEAVRAGLWERLRQHYASGGTSRGGL